MSKLTILKKYIEENREQGVAYVKKTFSTGGLTEEKIFYMLTFCILVPGGKATKTDEAVRKLKELNYFYSRISNYRLYNLLKPLVRFPKQKTVRLIQLKKKWDKIKILARLAYKTKKDSKEVRALLMENVFGLGPKASSHFLRNLGRKDIAILDTHILKYRKNFMPKGKKGILPNSLGNYLTLEENFNKWAKETFDLEPAYLDWCIWCMEANVDIEQMEY